MKNLDILIEQYKSYMDDLREIRNQHSQTRAFYVSIISAILIFLSLTGPKEALAKINTNGQFAVSLLGIILSIAWFIHTRSYRNLFLAKFNILREMEKKMPFQIFEKEWVELKKLNFSTFTSIESFVSLSVSIPFIILLFSIY